VWLHQTQAAAGWCCPNEGHDLFQSVEEMNDAMNSNTTHKEKELSLEVVQFDISKNLSCDNHRNCHKCEMCEILLSPNIPQIVDRKPDNTSHHVRFGVEDDVHTHESVETHGHD